jgi:hypothetical protein
VVLVGTLISGNALIVGVVVIVVVLVWLVPAWFVAMHAEKKGYSFWGFLVLALFVSWVLALAASLLLNDRGARGPTMRCPECAETILAAARVCRYRGARLEPTASNPIS